MGRNEAIRNRPAQDWRERMRRWPAPTRAALLIGALALAGFALSFLISGIDLRTHAVRTVATVDSVETRKEPRSGHYQLFWLSFTDRSGKPHTESTEDVARHHGAIPQPGTRIEIYYASNDPANIAETHLGAPGTTSFQKAGLFAALLLLEALAIPAALYTQNRRWQKTHPGLTP